MILNRANIKSIPLEFLFIVFMICNGHSSGTKLFDGKMTRSGDSPIQEEPFVQIFDGQTLNNWEGDPSIWRAENGSLVGEITPTTVLKENTFIIWQGGELKDFELKTEFRITENGNSGINYRSELLDHDSFALKGYQVDIDGKNKYTGQNYEKGGRNVLAFRDQKVIVSSQANPKEPGSLEGQRKE